MEGSSRRVLLLPVGALVGRIVGSGGIVLLGEQLMWGVVERMADWGLRRVALLALLYPGEVLRRRFVVAG